MKPAFSRFSNISCFSGKFKKSKLQSLAIFANFNSCKLPTVGNAIIKNPFSCKLLQFLTIFAKLSKITSYFSSHCKAKLENITSKPSQLAKPTEDKKLIETYKQQDKDLRLLTYKILVETFNKKYTNLDDSQKNLLKEYINNITNTTKFKDYVGIELPKIVAELKSIKSKVEDKVTTIKLSETISVLEKMKMGKTVSDSQVSSIMLSYELIKELKSKLK